MMTLTRYSTASVRLVTRTFRHDSLVPLFIFNKKAMNCDIGNKIIQSVQTICNYPENPMK